MVRLVRCRKRRTRMVHFKKERERENQVASYCADKAVVCRLKITQQLAREKMRLNI